MLASGGVKSYRRVTRGASTYKLYMVHRLGLNSPDGASVPFPAFQRLPLETRPTCNRAGFRFFKVRAPLTGCYTFLMTSKVFAHSLTHGQDHGALSFSLNPPKKLKINFWSHEPILPHISYCEKASGLNEQEFSSEKRYFRYCVF